MTIGSTISYYRIVAKLGEGGMGVVYKAEDTKLERTVALKFLAQHLLNDEEAKQRFLREAKAAAALHHSNVCPVHEIDEVDGKTFLAMAFLEGEALEDRIAQGPFSIKEALDIAHQVAEGLDAAHEKGVVHRDIKPANIIVDAKGHATIMDFGLARLTEASRLTKVDTAMGTVAYMSPEQAQGMDVDSRSTALPRAIRPSPAARDCPRRSRPADLHSRGRAHGVGVHRRQVPSRIGMESFVTANRNDLMQILRLAALVLFAVTLAAQSPARDAPIIQIVADYNSARDSQDPQAIEKLFTDDADQLVSTGVWRRGKDTLVKGMLASSAGNPGDRTITVDTVRFVTADVALADARYEIAASANQAARKMWSTFLVVKKPDGWRIAAIRNMLPAK